MYPRVTALYFHALKTQLSCAASSSEAAVRAVMDGFAAAAAASSADDAGDYDSQPDINEALAADLAARKEGVRARLAQLQQVCAWFCCTVIANVLRSNGLQHGHGVTDLTQQGDCG